jgi:hypothetical protein
LKVREQDGNPPFILRSVSEEDLEEALPAVLPVPPGR